MQIILCSRRRSASGKRAIATHEGIGVHEGFGFIADRTILSPEKVFRTFIDADIKGPVWLVPHALRRS